jgi:quinol monooxygenase YgiN
MVYRVKWITKIDDKLGLSDEEYAKKMLEHGMDVNPSHSEEEHAIRQAHSAFIKQEMDAGNLLARSSIDTPDKKEIHTVAVWKNKAVFAKAFKNPAIQDYINLRIKHGWVTEKVNLD